MDQIVDNQNKKLSKAQLFFRFIFKIGITFLFIWAAYAITVNAPYYVEKVHYAPNEIRFIIDDEEKTKSLPDEIIIEKNNVLLSIDTIKKFFDEYIYFDEKYDTLIVAKGEYVYKMPVDSNTITINGEEKQIDVPVKIEKIKETITLEDENQTDLSGDKTIENKKSTEVVEVEKVYVPIKELSSLYNINVEYNEKVVVTTNEAKYYTVVAGKKIHTKLYQRELSLTTERVREGEKLDIFDTEYENKNDEDYIFVRTENGSLGYVKKVNIAEKEIVNTPTEITEVVEKPKKKINLTWEYAENYTPNRSNEEKIAGLDIICPTWLYLNDTNGDLTDKTSEDYISWAKSRGYEIWPTIKNDSKNLNETSEFVTDMHNRQNFIDNVVNLCNKYNFKGINLDFENMYMKDRNEYSELVRELAVALRRKDVILSVDVNVPDGSETWSRCFDSKAISDAADYIIVMTYDQYGTSSKIAGPVASLEWVESNIIKMTERDKIETNKLVLGVPFYSRRFTLNSEGTVQGVASLYMNSANEYLSKYKSNATWSDEDGQYIIKYTSKNNEIIIYVENEDSLEKKVELVNKYDLAGVASWRRGQETSSSWKVINDTLER